MTSRRVGLALGAALLMLAGACDSKEITKANDNPNSPTDAPSQALFTNASRNAVGRWQDGVGGTRYGFMSQHLAEAQYPDDDAYTRLRASGTSGLFNASYSSELQDLELIIRRGTAANQPGLSGPAQILKLWEFGVLTDVFGDVPYSQAFKADSLVLSPKYDPQLDIYTDMFAKLTAASSALGGASNQLLAADPIYGGSPAQWRKFANSLRERRRHQRQSRPAYPPRSSLERRRLARLTRRHRRASCRRGGRSRWHRCFGPLRRVTKDRMTISSTHGRAPETVA